MSLTWPAVIKGSLRETSTIVCLSLQMFCEYNFFLSHRCTLSREKHYQFCLQKNLLFRQFWLAPLWCTIQWHPCNMQPHLYRHSRRHRNDSVRCPERRANLTYTYIRWMRPVPPSFASHTHGKLANAAQMVMKTGKGKRSCMHDKMCHPLHLVRETVQVQGMASWVMLLIL